MRLLIPSILCLLAGAVLLPRVIAQPAAPAAPQAQPTTRNWLSGPSTKPIIIVPATRPTLERPMLALKYDASQYLLTVTLTNKGTEPVVVDGELVIPIYFTFFNERDLPIRLETDNGPDPEKGKIPERFVTLAPGQSIDRVVDLTGPFPTWMSGTVETFVNEERVTIPFGREKYRKLTDSKIKRIQVVYAIMPADRDAIQSYTTMSIDDLKLFSGTATADLTVADEPQKQP